VCYFDTSFAYIDFYKYHALSHFSGIFFALDVVE
jgi:hypothetical protein